MDKNLGLYRQAAQPHSGDSRHHRGGLRDSRRDREAEPRSDVRDLRDSRRRPRAVGSVGQTGRRVPGPERSRGNPAAVAERRPCRIRADRRSAGRHQNGAAFPANAGCTSSARPGDFSSCSCSTRKARSFPATFRRWSVRSNARPMPKAATVAGRVQQGGHGDSTGKFAEEVRHREAERTYTANLTHGQLYVLRELRILFEATDRRRHQGQRQHSGKGFPGSFDRSGEARIEPVTAKCRHRRRALQESDPNLRPAQPERSDGPAKFGIREQTHSPYHLQRGIGLNETGCTGQRLV